jgi:hypothetical protein
MNKPFNLEEVKQGKPYTYSGKYYCKGPLHYIGMTKDGKIVSENQNGVVVSMYPKELKMIPTQKTYYVNLYFKYNEVFAGKKHTTLDHAIENIDDECCGSHIKTVEILIEE